MMKRNAWLAGIPLSVALAAGCGIAKDLGSLDTDSNGDTQGDDGDGGSDNGDDGVSSMGSADGGGDSGDGGGDSGDGGSDTGWDPPAPSGKVDVLFVVDNSGSMGEEQGTLASNLYTFTNALTGAGVDFRIAVTTTDNGNPWCTGTTPEAGRFRFSSCRQRTSDFVFNGAQMIDATQQGCLDVCELDSFAADATTTDEDPQAKPRPWVQWAGPDDNNITGMDPATILACALPMGISGCGYEQPLESMFKALQRAQTSGETELGFIRNDANLLVIFVTDEADCSHNPDHESIFLPDGDRTFWSLPEEGAPTSAVCWNAGVQCLGNSPYESCEPAHLAADGTPTTEDQAVMHPPSRYVELLHGLQAGKTAGRVAVMAFVGRATNGDFVYADTMDQAFQDDFGIGPGCSSQAGQAVPPVRIRAVANAVNEFFDDGLYSICDSDFSPAFQAAADEIISWAS